MHILRISTIVLSPLFGFGLTRIDFSVAYLWTFVALLLGCVGIVMLVWALRRQRSVSPFRKEGSVL